MNYSSPETLLHFLRESLRSLAHTTLPFVNAAHSTPGHAVSLDDQFDATVTCPVARRASLTQGKALITIWEKAFLEDKSMGEAYRVTVKSGIGGHFGVAWGVVCAHCDISKGRSIRSDADDRTVHACFLVEPRKGGDISCSSIESCGSVSSTNNSCQAPNSSIAQKCPG